MPYTLAPQSEEAEERAVRPREHGPIEPLTEDVGATPENYEAAKQSARYATPSSNWDAGELDCQIPPFQLGAPPTLARRISCLLSAGIPSYLTRYTWGGCCFRRLIGPITMARTRLSRLLCITTGHGNWGTWPYKVTSRERGKLLSEQGGAWHIKGEPSNQR